MLDYLVGHHRTNVFEIGAGVDAGGVKPLRRRRAGKLDSTDVAALGLGIDRSIGDFLSAGFVSRYYPGLRSALLDRPTYVTMNARVSLIFK